MNAITIEKIKETVSKSLALKILLSLLLMAVLVLYFKSFFTTGVHFNNTFLKKKVTSSGTHYMGRDQHGDIHISTEKSESNPNSVKVTYKLPNEIHRQYAVTFSSINNKGLLPLTITGKDGSVIFWGQYSRDSNLFFDEKGDLSGHNFTITVVYHGSPYTSDYEAPLKNIVEFANASTDTIRGRYVFLILAVFIFILLFIDIKFPLFFFTLNHILSVKDPEPSEFYIIMQRLSWFILPLIGIILMMVAIA